MLAAAACSQVSAHAAPPPLPQWLEQGAAAFSADDLTAVGNALCGKSVGDVEHGEGGAPMILPIVLLLMAAVLSLLPLGTADCAA